MKEAGFARLAMLASRRHGVFTAADARAAGVTRKQVFGAVKAGRCRRLMPRVYAMTDVAREHDQLPLEVGGARLVAPGMLQELAGLIASGGEGAVLSHRTAALLHGFEGPEIGIPDVTVPTERSIETDRIRVHHADVDEDDVVELEGLRVTSIARTFLDLAAVCDHETVSMAFHHAWRQEKVTPAQLRLAVRARRGKGVRGVLSLEAVLEDASRFSRPMESAAEVRFFCLVRRAGDLPLPRGQRWLRVAAGERVRVDFYFEAAKLAVEIDSYERHASTQAHHDRTSERATKLRACGVRLVPFTPNEMRRSPERVMHALRRELAAAMCSPES